MGSKIQSLSPFRREVWREVKTVLHPSENRYIYSVRVSKNYRAVGVRNESGIVWYWIGTHADYDNLLFQF
ncbi:ParE family toxin-like protein [Nostoc sp.]|uniref:ParE family toxin-like protein n=1 Tax=Nostoc sp. TaxID=1180 RepID=UPI003FA5CF70